MRKIITFVAAVAVLSTTFASPALAQSDRRAANTTQIKQCPDFISYNGGWIDPSGHCNSIELTAFLASRGIAMASPVIVSAPQGPTWEQTQAPAPYHDQVVRANYQHTCEPTRAGGNTCYGRDPGPSALEWVAVVGGLTTRVIYATRHNYRW